MSSHHIKNEDEQKHKASNKSTKPSIEIKEEPPMILYEGTKVVTSHHDDEEEESE